jgi:MFS family permease
VANGFFGVDSYGLVIALGITGAAQPLIGFLSDHIGVRFTFNLWLLLCGAVACAVPIFIIQMKREESVEQILAANTNSSAYASLLTVAVFGAVSLQTSVASAVTYLFGIYSGGRAFTLVRTISRLLALTLVCLPIYLGGWHTNTTLYWITAGLMGLGFLAACFLNPHSLVKEPAYSLEKVDVNDRRNKYASI